MFLSYFYEIISQFLCRRAYYELFYKLFIANFRLFLIAARFLGPT